MSEVRTTVIHRKNMAADVTAAVADGHIRSIILITLDQANKIEMTTLGDFMIDPIEVLEDALETAKSERDKAHGKIN